MYILYYKLKYEPISMHLTMLQFYTKIWYVLPTYVSIKILKILTCISVTKYVCICTTTYICGK